MGSLLFKNDCDYDIGPIQIWQDPRYKKGTWQKAMIIVWIPKFNGYYMTVFDDGKDFVQQRPNTIEETRQILKTLPQGLIRYSDVDVQRYRSKYGA